jgi:laminin, alpha 1/2
MSSNESMKVVKTALETSVKVSDQMREVRREALDINNDVYKLKQKLADLEPDWESKLGMAAENGN